MKKIILVDGHNLLFRMFYGIPAQIKNSQGKEIKGLVGFIGSLKKIIDKFNPDSLIVIFDSETSKDNNLKIDNEYKSNRPNYTDIDEEKNPFSQLPMIKKALDYTNVKFVEIENYEADDYIASIVSSNIDDGYQYIMVSTDSDFIQLVNGKVYLYVPRGKNGVLYDEKEVLNKYNVPPSKYVFFKSLVGDRSDNIRGIKGIGNSIASKILKYDSIQDFILNNPDSKYSEILINNQKIIEKNIRLIGMNKNLDVSNIYFSSLSDKIINYKTYEIIKKIGER